MKQDSEDGLSGRIPRKWIAAAWFTWTGWMLGVLTAVLFYGAEVPI